MESPKIGIVILVLVALSSLMGGWAGWKIRQQQHPESSAASPVIDVAPIDKQLALDKAEIMSIKIMPGGQRANR